ncbi:MAG: hypothetical protein AAFW95_10975 [Cyanobacteria bacterium J06638_6]
MQQRFRFSALTLMALGILSVPTLLSYPVRAQTSPLEFSQQGIILAAPTQMTYAPGDAITVEFAGLPGNAQDWITVVEANAPDDTYGEWFYTGGQRSGTYTFDGLEPGTYEVRTYFDWPEGSYVVRSRSRFAVGTATAAPGGYTQLAPRHRVNQPITVQFSGLPGYAQDWITLVEAGAPDDTYGEWFYTNGQNSGSHTFSGVPAGTYEVRVYFNWPDGGYVVQERDRIVVE